MPKEAISKGVIVHVHDKGWMDENGWKIQVEKVWSKCPGGLLEKPALLVLDQFRVHTTEATKKRFKEEKTHLAVIPGGAYQPVACNLWTFPSTSHLTFSREKTGTNGWLLEITI